MSWRVMLLARNMVPWMLKKTKWKLIQRKNCVMMTSAKYMNLQNWFSLRSIGDDKSELMEILRELKEKASKDYIDILLELEKLINTFLTGEYLEGKPILPMNGEPRRKLKGSLVISSKQHRLKLLVDDINIIAVAFNLYLCVWMMHKINYSLWSSWSKKNCYHQSNL